MRDRAYKKECAEKVKASRAKLAVDLKQLGFRLWDSQTNFILAQTPKGNAEQLYLALKERVILVATSSSLVREDKVRIKVGNRQFCRSVYCQQEPIYNGWLAGTAKSLGMRTWLGCSKINRTQRATSEGCNAPPE